MTRQTNAQTELAHAKARLLSGEAAPRVAARRAVQTYRDQLAPLPDAVLLAAADTLARERITRLAAAAFHGGHIARAISGAARHEISEHVDDEARRFALTHRNLASLETDDTEFAAQFAATQCRLKEELDALLYGEPEYCALDRGCVQAAIDEVRA
jgi:hypothetical protein